VSELLLKGKLFRAPARQGSNVSGSLYDHVLGLNGLNPIELSIPPKVVVKSDIPCQHFLKTYLHLLSRLAGGNVLALDAQCAC